jgi:hypothetical protein
MLLGGRELVAGAARGEILHADVGLSFWGGVGRAEGAPPLRPGYHMQPVLTHEPTLPRVSAPIRAAVDHSRG